MLRPLLFGLGCFLLFAPGFDGQKTIPGDDSKPPNEIPDVSELKDNLGKIKADVGQWQKFVNSVTTQIEGLVTTLALFGHAILILAVVILALVVLILVAVFIQCLYKICIKHRQLQLMCQRPTMSYASEKPSVG
ncbi:hypothetical protein GPALN_005239 [Globodera pallida]|nr:hypothetical protein GPALN_005239 [Globodera pallida]